MRDLQSEAFLTELLRKMRERREALRERHGRNVALVLKISPDGDEDGLQIIADVTRRERADGIIAANTTVSREGVEGLPHGIEEGGLSGAPLFRRSTQVLRTLAAMLHGEIPLIGGGGIMSAADAREKFEAGASLIQIYSGLVFRGPRLIAECVAAYRGGSLRGTPSALTPSGNARALSEPGFASAPNDYRAKTSAHGAEC